MSVTVDISALAERLRALETPADDAERVDVIGELEALRSAVAAVQAQVTVAFADAQCTEQAARGITAERVGRGVAAQVALARRISPNAAARYLSFARTLTTELPETFAALASGATSEWRAVLVHRETAWLSKDGRAEADRLVGPRLGAMGDRQAANEARRHAQHLDPRGAVAKARNAESDRRVTIQPAPDTMCRLSALVPVAQGVAAYAALRRHADTTVGVGSETRCRGQVMADTLIERITGQASADDVPVEVQLVMTDTALFDPPGAPAEQRDEPAWLVGHGPIAADLARRLVAERAEESPTWLRRLYRHPDTGRLTAMESCRRAFTPAQRRFVSVRDQFCRTPWCGAPIRHTDHVRPHERHGPTSLDNAQGLCEACNYAKQAPGWRAEVAAGGEIVTVTPTGHAYVGQEPVFFLPPRRIEVDIGRHAA